MNNIASSGLPAWTSGVRTEPRAPGWVSVEEAATKPLSFQDIMLKSLEKVAEMDQTTQAQISSSLTGGDLTQAEVLSSMKKTELAYRLLLQIRNKVLDAYNEIQQMRM